MIVVVVDIAFVALAHFPPKNLRGLKTHGKRANASHLDDSHHTSKKKQNPS